MINILEAQALVQFERDLPALLDEIALLEAQIEPTKKDIADRKAEVKSFMRASGLSEYESGDWRIALIAKVRKTRNVELVQKAVSKTMWERITKYVDPNGGKKGKNAYTETTSDTLTIKREVVETPVAQDSAVKMEVK